MEQETFYKVKYRDVALDEEKEVLISAPHSVIRNKEILSEVHRNWEIQDIIPKEGASR